MARMNRPAPVEVSYKHMRFLITHNPTNATLSTFIEDLKKYEDAIQFIRQKRRGAINSKQLTYLEKYRPKQRLRFKDPHTHKTRCCVM
uniref:Isoform 3 of Protein tyrosine phosphatase type IVA 3 n=1 Tax=Homo sapiens TaxID=9606 RepID=O75365-3|nr:protein tyrosine phosphatase short form [Homo sapiens]